MGVLDVSAEEARRIAVRAVGLGGRRPARPTRAHLRALARRMGLFQIDAVNVLERAHYLPAFSRLGPYPQAWLDDLAYRERALYEGFGHALSYIDIELWPLFEWRRRRSFEDHRWVASRERIERERPGYQAAVLEELRAGPRSWNTLRDPGRIAPRATNYAESSLMWSRWSEGKTLLEGLFVGGHLAVSHRVRFDPQYAHVDTVIPAAILARPVPDEADAKRELIRIATTNLGIGTLKDAADWFRLSVADAKRAVSELLEEGALVPARVEGWQETAWMVAGASARPVTGAAVVSPFDPLVWERTRARRLWDFDYRIEIYVPAAKRIHGYYVLPFLLGDRLVARVDLKADRAAGVLRVPNLHFEPGVDRDEVTAALDTELALVARWLGLSPAGG